MTLKRIFIRILHSLGFSKKVQHIDDITLNISEGLSSNITNDYNKFPIGDINVMKEKIFSKFKEDLKFKKRCELVGQVYLTFYENIKDKGCGSLCITFNYCDGVLYFPYNESEFKAYKRALKLKEIGIN